MVTAAHSQPRCYSRLLWRVGGSPNCTPSYALLHAVVGRTARRRWPYWTPVGATHLAIRGTAMHDTQPQATKSVSREWAMQLGSVGVTPREWADLARGEGRPGRCRTGEAREMSDLQPTDAAREGARTPGRGLSCMPGRAALHTTVARTACCAVQRKVEGSPVGNPGVRRRQWRPGPPVV